VQLQQELERPGLPNCRPLVRPAAERALTSRQLYELNLGVHLGGQVVTNDVSAEGVSLIMISGTNQGGRSTTLRAIGLAQLLTQARCIVPAAGHRASVATGLFTHDRRDEDTAMISGKLDEELARMSKIVEYSHDSNQHEDSSQHHRSPVYPATPAQKGA
jgi:DNA mismatch repair ATPase MutS